MLDASCSTAESTSTGLRTVGGPTTISTAGEKTSQSTSIGLRTEGREQRFEELSEGLIARMEVKEATLEVEGERVERLEA